MKTQLSMVRPSRAVTILAAPLVGALLLLACGPRAVPGTPPTLEGMIVAVNEAGGDRRGDRTIHVKETPEEQCGIIFSLDAGTEILARDARDRLAEVPPDSLTAGRSVRVWSGAVAESCPAQSRAITIELLATEVNMLQRPR